MNRWWILPLCLSLTLAGGAVLMAYHPTTEDTGSRSIHHRLGTGGSFGSSGLQQEIGQGDAEAIESARLCWPGSDREQVFTDLELDRFYLAAEGDAELKTVSVACLRWRARAANPAVEQHHHGDA